jgi:hypothetical protein
MEFSLGAHVVVYPISMQYGSDSCSKSSFLILIEFVIIVGLACWSYLNLLHIMQVAAADYILPTPVSNFRNAWESLDSESERVDEYSLGARENIQEAVQAVTTILGMQPCEVGDLNKLYWLS